MWLNLFFKSNPNMYRWRFQILNENCRYCWVCKNEYKNNNTQNKKYFRSKYRNKSILGYGKFCCNTCHYKFYSHLKMIRNWDLIFPTMSEEDAKVAERENFGSFVFWRVVWNSIKNLVCLDKETFIFRYLATYQNDFLYFWYCHQFISPKLLLLVD